MPKQCIRPLKREVSIKSAVMAIGAIALSIIGGAGTSAAQTVLWENRGQVESGGAAVEARGDASGIVAAGLVNGNPTSGQWFVRGLDRKSGAALWEDRFGPDIFGLAKDVVVDGRRAFVAGWIFTPGLGYEFVVRSYDVASGALLWSQEVKHGDQCGNERPNFARCIAKSLSVHDGRVFVVGHLTHTASRSDFAVLAFDARTGTQLWESITDPTGTGGNDYAWSVSARDSGVYVLGEVGDFSALLVRAYDPRTGAIRWEHLLPGGRDFTLKDTLAADDQTVFISGSDDQSHFFVHAYNARTGALRWTDSVADTGQFGQVVALALPGEDAREKHRGADDADRVYAFGVAGCDPVTFTSCKLVVRAYSWRRGLVWARADPAPGGDWTAYVGAAGNGRVFAGAGELLEDGAYHGVVRAYSAHDGTFHWSALQDDGAGRPVSFVDSLFVRGGRLIVADQAQREDGGSDFLVRKYKAR